MAKDRLAGDFIRVSHDWRMREKELKRQATRTTDGMYQVVLEIPTYTPVTAYFSKPPTKTQLKKLYENFTDRYGFKKENWQLKAQAKKRRLID